MTFRAVLPTVAPCVRLASGRAVVKNPEHCWRLQVTPIGKIFGNTCRTGTLEERSVQLVNRLKGCRCRMSIKGGNFFRVRKCAPVSARGDFASRIPAGRDFRPATRHVPPPSSPGPGRLRHFQETAPASVISRSGRMLSGPPGPRLPNLPASSPALPFRVDP